MNATNKLLDKWMTWRSSKPGADLRQSAIAIELGVKQTAISNYKVGVSQAAPHVIAKMARDLGENEAAWLALVESERARDASDRRAWLKVARQLGAAAALAVVALLPQGNAHANPTQLIDSASAVRDECILCKVLRRLAARLLRAPARVLPAIPVSRFTAQGAPA